MQTFEQIQSQVGCWSIANFGDQDTTALDAVHSKAITNKPTEEQFPLSNVVVRLGSLAPLLGVVEEVGELFESIDQKDQIDACGDIFIYLCDYACREGIKLPHKMTWPEQECQLPPDMGMVAMAGRLCHCHLKKMQGIRGMSDPIKFKEKRMAALQRFLYYLKSFVVTSFGADENGRPKQDLLTIANETWNKVVKKRNWKKYPKQGGNHVH